MANYRKFNAKLASLRNMRRVTKTMKMVSATKLRKAQAAEDRASRFAARVREVAANFLGSPDVGTHPLVRPRTPLHNGLLLVISADKGLCAGFNSNLIREVTRWIGENKHRFRRLRVSFCGRRAFTALRDQVEVRNVFEGIVARPTFAGAVRMGADLTGAFRARRYDEVHMAYNLFKNAATQEPVVVRLLPVAEDVLPKAASSAKADYIFDPGVGELLDMFLAKMVHFSIYGALLHNAAGEHGARMTAMENATTNIDNLSLLYTKRRNQARQASITGELIEIISGAEALK
jgi:F-type H+-transporting ATPase subunit gamma